MKTLRHSLTIAVLALALPAVSVEPLPVGPRQSSVAAFTATASIVSGLGLRKTADLEIGAVRTGGAAGSITAPPEAAARFELSGGGAADAARLRVSLPDRVVLRGGSGGETLTARDFTGRLVTGEDRTELVVGATFDVGSGQAGGRYTGTFTVTVNES